MDMLWLRIGGSILFIIGMVFFIYYARRKSERDFKEMQLSSRKHDDWMVNFGRMLEHNEQERSKR